ncbi:TetR/AcrR family transcriptional regulator [Tsukamurella soli]|uniref:TetR/AcrR family transcriptional regulator n=1 Tax=Tsukamurella soli TaxID=644556 RepID=A0ABP8JEH5_9ACTN
MARRKNQTAAREALIAAAMTALDEGGPGDLQIRDVARVAGVTPGTVHYYFDDRDTLLRAVHAAASDRFYSARLERVTTIPDGRAKIEALIESGLPAADGDPLVRSLYRLAGYRAATDDHGDLLGALYDKQVAVYVGALEVGVAQGFFHLIAPVITIARHLVALEDAYGLHIIGGNRTLTRVDAIELIAAYARMVTGCPDIHAAPEDGAGDPEDDPDPEPTEEPAP